MAPRSRTDALWRAITDGEQTARYYYGTAFRPADGELRAGARYTYDYPDGSAAADGEILEVDPPRRLAMTFHALWDPEIAAEAPLRQVWEIEPAADGTCRLTVVTEGLIAGTKSAAEFEGGIVLIVSGLKTMLETGEALLAEAADAESRTGRGSPPEAQPTGRWPRRAPGIATIRALPAAGRMVLSWPSSQRTRYRGPALEAITSRISPSRAGRPTRSDSITIRSPTLTDISAASCAWGLRPTTIARPPPCGQSRRSRSAGASPPTVITEGHHGRSARRARLR